MELPTLYHWSPVERRDEILNKGLQLYQRPTVSGDYSFPYVCLGPSPKTAWSISGDMDYVSEIEEWDLWEVRLPEDAEIHIRAEFGPRFFEIRVRTPIPADCVWLVGTRSPLSAKETK